MAPSKNTGLDVSFKRAMLFLNLAVEQLRLYDGVVADAVHVVHVDGLSEIFERVLRQVDDDQTLSEQGRRRASMLERVGKEAFEDATVDMPLPPPGLGYGLLREARPRVWEKSENTESDLKPFQDNQWPAGGATATTTGEHQPSSSVSQSSSLYGTIGDRRTSMSSRDVSGERASAMLAAAFYKKSEPRAKTGVSGHSITPSAPRSSVIKQAAIPSVDFTPKPNVELRSGHGLVKDSPITQPSDREPSPAPSITITSPDNNPPEPPIELPPTQPSKTNSSWATIAAIPKTTPAPVSFSGHLTSGLPKAALPIRKPRSSSAPSEPLTDQLRAVWIANLPPHYTLRDVSVQINEGPLMSILVGEDMADMLPGRSACVIFELAEHARAFLAANNNGVPVPATNVSPLPAGRYAATAPDAYILPGAPYPADADILSMAAPTYARRRLKWSRSRLFYDVPLAVFKEDVYSIVGGDENVELFHFYNPGECTVVFSSVKVAAVCYERFRAWKREVARRDESGGLLAAAAAAVGGGGGGGFGRGASSGEKGGRYEKVDITYVHDFNEAPAKLFSQFGGDGSVRKGACEVGVEGLFSGPPVVAAGGSAGGAGGGGGGKGGGKRGKV